MKKQFYFILFFAGIICLFAQSCSSDNEQLTTDQNKGKYNYTVNLFPPEKVVQHNEAGELNFDEAFAESSIVIYAPSVRMVDSSYLRGVRLFYIYRAPLGKVKKNTGKYYKNNGVLFLSNKALFEGETTNDSVYLFLKPLEGYNILRYNLQIPYEWVAGAPLLTQPVNSP
jgi:hypothetical protein